VQARLSDFKIIVLHLDCLLATLASAHWAGALSSWPWVFIGVAPLITCSLLLLLSIAESWASYSLRSRSILEAPVVSVFSSSSSSSLARVLWAVPIPRSAIRLLRASIPPAPVTFCYWGMPLLEAGKCLLKAALRASRSLIPVSSSESRSSN